jgi:hypothetical protein
MPTGSTIFRHPSGKAGHKPNLGPTEWDKGAKCERVDCTYWLWHTSCMSEQGEDDQVSKGDPGAESSGKRYIKVSVGPGNAELAGSIFNLPKIDTSALFPSVQITNALLP